MPMLKDSTEQSDMIWLDLHDFESVEHAQFLATQWLWTYNNERPNTAIGGAPPSQMSLVA